MSITRLQWTKILNYLILLYLLDKLHFLSHLIPDHYIFSNHQEIHLTSEKISRNKPLAPIIEGS